MVSTYQSNLLTGRTYSTYHMTWSGPGKMCAVWLGFFTQGKLCLCECGKVPMPVSPPELARSNKILNTQTNNWLHHHNIECPFLTRGVLYFLKDIPQPALRCCTVPISHTHTRTLTQCLVFRFIKPQCYPEWLTGWGTAPKSPPAGIHSHYHWEKASLVSALVTARGGTTN